MMCPMCAVSGSRQYLAASSTQHQALPWSALVSHRGVRSSPGARVLDNQEGVNAEQHNFREKLSTRSSQKKTPLFGVGQTTFPSRCESAEKRSHSLLDLVSSPSTRAKQKRFTVLGSTGYIVALYVFGETVHWLCWAVADTPCWSARNRVSLVGPAVSQPYSHDQLGGLRSKCGGSVRRGIMVPRASRAKNEIKVC